jgi:hypothetical protein
VNCGHGSIVAGVHGLQHIDNFFATGFTDDDTVRAHPQGVAQTVALTDATFALNVWRAAFHLANVGLLQLEFGRVLNGEDAFVVINKRLQRVERGRFTRTRTTRDDDVQTDGHGGLQIRSHFFGEGTKFHQVINAQFVFLELTNGYQ